MMLALNVQFIYAHIVLFLDHAPLKLIVKDLLSGYRLLRNSKKPMVVHASFQVPQAERKSHEEANVR